MAQVQERSGLTVTPDGLVNKYPCLQCLSQKELLAVIALTIYALTNSGSIDVGDMTEGAACWCVSDKQMLVAIAAALIAIAIANDYFDDADAAIRAVSCLTCADSHTLKAIIVKATGDYIDDQWPP